jgi:hypothetical protein
VRGLEALERLIVIATAGAQVGVLAGRFHGVCGGSLRAS